MKNPFDFIGAEDQRCGMVMRVILGDWTLIERYEAGGLKRYHPATDPRERSDMARQEPARLRTMAARLPAWRKAVDARIPMQSAESETLRPANSP